MKPQSNTLRLLALCGFFLGVAASAVAQGSSLVNSVSIPGDANDRTDLHGRKGGANVSRLGGFGSDLFYDRKTGFFYGLADRGPGGGTIPYDTRVEKFRLSVDPHTGAIDNFQLVDTIYFTLPAGKTVNGVSGPLNFNGFDPKLDAPYGSENRLGRSFDPEGFVVAPNGNFYVSDEYGPSIYEFRPNGGFVRALTIPANIAASDRADATSPYFSALSAAKVKSGRQANRGFEGLAISPNGGRVFAILQDPLAEEGSGGADRPGRFSQNIRIVVFDAGTGRSVAQYVYPLESLASVNARVPGNTFAANAQGANIGVSALTALNDHELLVMERDNRGLGLGDLTGTTPPIATKRIYKIDVNGATDLSHPEIHLAGTNALPQGVAPVQKSLFLDVQAALSSAGLKIPEKMEGLAIGPKLDDGSYVLIVGTDNDFSVTQLDSGVQFDVCTDARQIPLDSGCEKGSTLIPTFFYSFKTSFVGTEKLVTETRKSR